jgi:dTDP-4-amino-4,6-dideoxygalactose transaminase
VTPQIPFADVRVEQEDLDAVAATLSSGWLTMGPRAMEFEEAFASFLGCRHAVLVSSCTAALHLAYVAAGVGPGDEVIVPSYTFVATANAVVHAGATPVFADIVGERDLGIDPQEVERLITSRTKAVVAVHFAGYCAAVDVLTELCADRGIALIEDVAHAPGATLGGRRTGTFGLAGAFSFFSNKVLLSGEGGLLATDDDDVAAVARSLRSHAMTSGTWDRHTARTQTYDVTGLGFNYRLDEPRAALLLSRFGRMESEIERRRERVREYRGRLSATPGLSVPFRDEEVATSSAYVMPVLVDDPARREPIRKELLERHGVQTSVFYPPVHEFTAYRRRFPCAPLPRTEDAGRREITIPLYPHMTDAEQEHVIGALQEVLG